MTFNPSIHTRLLLKFDGIPGSATLVDSGLDDCVVQANGDFILSDTQAKFGPTSGFSEGDYATPSWAVATLANPVGSSDFTIECFAFTGPGNPFDLSIGYGEGSVFSLGDDFLSLDISYSLNGDRNAAAIYASNYLDFFGDWYGGTPITDPTFIISNAWNHFALTRSGDNLYFHTNGKLRATYDLTGYDITDNKVIVSNYTTSGGRYLFPGYIDELRVSSFPVYTEGTYSIPTIEFSTVPSGLLVPSLAFNLGAVAPTLQQRPSTVEIYAPVVSYIITGLAPYVPRQCVLVPPPTAPLPQPEEAIFTPVPPGIEYESLPVIDPDTQIIDTSPDQIIGCANELPDGREQLILGVLFPGAVSGDGVINRENNDVWTYDGSAWTNVGPTPGPQIVVVSVLPPWNEVSVYSARVRTRMVVQSLDYALKLLQNVGAVVTRTLVSAEKLVRVSGLDSARYEFQAKPPEARLRLSAIAGVAVSIYTGNGQNQSIADVPFSPGLVWIKSLGGGNHSLFDASRGRFTYLGPNLTTSELSLRNTLVSFDGNGFSLSTNSLVNASNAAFVAWSLPSIGTPQANSQGTIPSQTAASDYYSVVQYTGTGPGNQSFGHGLTSAPDFIIIRNRGSSSSWVCGGNVLGDNNNILLHTESSLFSTASGISSANEKTVNLGSIPLFVSDNLNVSGSNYVAYCFHNKQKLFKAGTYTGNGDEEGLQVDVGFKPRFLVVKKLTNAAGSAWNLIDDARDRGNNLLRITNAAETTVNDFYALNRDGFLAKTGGGNTLYDLNTDGSSYLYLAFGVYRSTVLTGTASFSFTALAPEQVGIFNKRIKVPVARFDFRPKDPLVQGNGLALDVATMRIITSGHDPVILPYDYVIAGQTVWPFLNIYEWKEGGFGDPIPFPEPTFYNTENFNAVAVSPTGRSFIITSGDAPYVHGYKISPYSQVEKVADPPSVVASTSSRSATFSPDGQSLVLGFFNVGLRAYRWSDETGFEAAYSSPSGTISNFLPGMAFSPSGDTIVTLSTGSPFIHAYQWTAEGFGVKYSNPSTLPTSGSQVGGFTFSKDGGAIIFGGTKPEAYQWSGSGFGVKYSDPPTLPRQQTVDVSMHPSGESLVFAEAFDFATPRTPMFACQWNTATGFGTVYSLPTTSANMQSGAAVSFSPDGARVMLSGGPLSSASPAIKAYEWSNENGFGAMVPDPSVFPTASSASGINMGTRQVRFGRIMA